MTKTGTTYELSGLSLEEIITIATSLKAHRESCSEGASGWSHEPNMQQGIIESGERSQKLLNEIESVLGVAL